uniref:Egg protein C3782 n=1 Tax=Schistosoma japonicum TaxID=6182 RepID=Q6PYV5_SCHJA|nr:egg protein C3782 [Schistosoma japonicum]
MIMFDPTILMKQFLVVFVSFSIFICNERSVITAQPENTEKPDIFEIILQVHVKEWNANIGDNRFPELIDLMDVYCKRVLEVVERLEPKLKMATLSCDINTKPRDNVTIDENNIPVTLAGFRTQMQKLFASQDWSSELQKKLVSNNVGEYSEWIIGITSVSEPTIVSKEYYPLNQGFNLKRPDFNECVEVKTAMSDRYLGFGETVDNCLLRDNVMYMNASTVKLLKSGYLGYEYNVVRRSHPGNR